MAFDANTTRRTLFAIAGGAAAFSAIPAAALVHRQSRLERIEAHKAALLALLRDEFPASATRISVALGADLETGRTYITATGLRKRWKTDDRLRGGGLWVEDSLGDWTPSRGLMVREPVR